MKTVMQDPIYEKLCANSPRKDDTRIIINHPYSYVYLSLFSDVEAVKIGWAYDVPARLKKLTKVWGEPELRRTQVIRFSSRFAITFEKVLHLMVHHYQKDVGPGEGKKEFFEPEVMEHIPKVIHHYNKINRSRVLMIPYNLMIDRKYDYWDELGSF